MVTLRDYPLIEVEAARAVVLELARVLGQYRQDVVLVARPLSPSASSRD